MPNLIASVLRNGKYPTVVKICHAYPFTIEPESPPRLVSDNGEEVEISSPGPPISLIDAGDSSATAQGPGGWGGRDP